MEKEQIYNVLIRQRTKQAFVERSLFVTNKLVTNNKLFTISFQKVYYWYLFHGHQWEKLENYFWFEFNGIFRYCKYLYENKHFILLQIFIPRQITISTQLDLLQSLQMMNLIYWRSFLAKVRLHIARTTFKIQAFRFKTTG